MYIIPHSHKYFKFLGVENVTIFTTGSLINKQCSFWLVFTKLNLLMPNVKYLKCLVISGIMLE